MPLPLSQELNQTLTYDSVLHFGDEEEDLSISQDEEEDDDSDNNTNNNTNTNTPSTKSHFTPRTNTTTTNTKSSTDRSSILLSTPQTKTIRNGVFSVYTTDELQTNAITNNIASTCCCSLWDYFPSFSLSNIPGLRMIAISPLLPNGISNASSNKEKRQKYYELEGQTLLRRHHKLWYILSYPFQCLYGKSIVGTFINMFFIVWISWFNLLDEVFIQKVDIDNDNDNDKNSSSSGESYHYWEWRTSFRDETFKYLLAAFLVIPLIFGIVCKFLVDVSNFDTFGILSNKVHLLSSSSSKSKTKTKTTISSSSSNGNNNNNTNDIRQYVEQKTKAISQYNARLGMTIALLLCGGIPMHYMYNVRSKIQHPQPVPNIMTNNFWLFRMIGSIVINLVIIIVAIHYINFITISCEYMKGNIAIYQEKLRHYLTVELKKVHNNNNNNNNNNKSNSSSSSSVISTREEELLKFERYLLEKVMIEVKNDKIQPTVKLFYHLIVVFFVLILTFLINRFADIASASMMNKENNVDINYQEAISKWSFPIGLLVGMMIMFFIICQPLRAMAAQKRAWDQVIQMLKFVHYNNDGVNDILLRVETYADFISWNVLGEEVTYESIQSLFVLLLKAIWITVFMPQLLNTIGFGGFGDD